MQWIHLVEGGRKWLHIDLLSIDGFRVILHKWCTTVCTTIYIYITDLVCYTYFHWFFNYGFSLLHIFSLVLQPCIYSENRRGIYFSPQKQLKHGRQNITFHSINGIIRNNKCIFTKLNAVFILKTAAWTKHITTVNSVTNTWSIQQTPMFHGCTITNKQSVEPWKLSTSWGHTKVLFTCC
jgi:hypothetical protein